MIKENIEAGLEWQNLSYRYTDWSNQTLGPKKKEKNNDSWNQIRTLDKLSLTFIRNTKKKKLA